MAVTEERMSPAARELLVADPIPLGLTAFALPLFLLGGYLADFMPNWVWQSPAILIGGLVQLLAGLWGFRNRDVIAATAFSIYGGFWLSLLLIGVGAFDSGERDLANGLAWLLLAMAIFNTYLLLASMRRELGVFAFFLALELTQVLLVISLFVAAHREISVTGSGFISDNGWVQVTGWAAIVTAAIGWLASAAGIVMGTGEPSWLAPLGRPLSWSRPPRTS